jgi:hypothetical protein
MKSSGKLFYVYITTLCLHHERSPYTTELQYYSIKFEIFALLRCCYQTTLSQQLPRRAKLFITSVYFSTDLRNFSIKITIYNVCLNKTSATQAYLARVSLPESAVRFNA